MGGGCVGGWIPFIRGPGGPSDCLIVGGVGPLGGPPTPNGLLGGGPTGGLRCGGAL